MTNMLVNLRQVNEDLLLKEDLSKQGIKIVRATMPDRKAIVEWVKRNSSIYAAGECEGAFSQSPISCFIAVKEKQLIGYACYNATAKDFFGPTRVKDEFRGLGIGKMLLIESLIAMRYEGYEYAIIGGVGPVEFYQKVVGAVVIENESSDLYDDFYKFEELS